MDTRQLEFFVAVAKDGSFTQAAHRLNAVQSTVSAGIATLERELGVRLFDRSTRRVELTAAGQELVPLAQTVLDSIAGMREIGSQTKLGLRGRVRVGIVSNIDWFDLPGLLGDFRREHPLVELSMRTSPRGSAGLAEQVRAGKLDLALVGAPEEELTGLYVTQLHREEFVAILPATHPLAASLEPLRMQDLVADPHIEVPPGFGNRTVLDHYLREAGLHRTISVEVPDLAAQAAYVRSGLGVAVTARSAARDYPGIVTKQLAVRLYWEFKVIAAKGRRDPATESLLRALEARKDY